MPELPEVETVVRTLRAAAAGAVIAGASARLPPPPHHLQLRRRDLAAIVGGVIGRVERAGKYILIGIVPSGTAASATVPPSPPPAAAWRLLLHLGMTGRVVVAAANEPVPRHTHFILRFADGRELRYTDPRRFGRAALGPADQSAADPAASVARGAEPLALSEEEFVRLFRGRAGAIKGLLLNQNLLRGLGNIYADESLHRAGLHPLARRLSAARLRRLRAAVLEVLEEAIAAGGSSIRDYVDATGRGGWFQTRHRVYARTGEPCVRCGAAIRRGVVAGRGTHYCPRCQRR